MKIYSHSSIGYEGELIEIEIDIKKGISGIDIVGLAGSEIKESRERVKSAIKNSNFNFPKDRILINLAPAGIKKLGTAFDLSIAISIIKIQESKDNKNLEILILGELQLDGKIRSIKAVLPAIALAKEKEIKFAIVPFENLEEARLIDGLNIWGVKDLKETIKIIEQLNGNILPPRTNTKQSKIEEDSILDYDFKNIKGQQRAKRAIEIAIAGGHNIMLFGPPGSGKTLSIKCAQSILPPLTNKELIETNRIWSISGKLIDSKIIKQRPFRNPHHTASKEGIIGGGPNPLPGEVSLAHNGILFLDEALEFKKSILQSLREPIEDKSISISRASSKLFKYPANFQLILAMNLCPCGNLGKKNTDCFCSQQEISNYWKKLGAAMLDRIDIRVPTRAINNEKLFSETSESSSEIKKRIIKARNIQNIRYENFANINKNSDLNADHIEKFCELSAILKNDLIYILNKLNISSRATHSILKIARTISDLKEEKNISREALLEAIEHRKNGENMLEK
ncbi:YifB family Mg chelatase-like AAA ATPase [Borreliella bissettiae]|uniref:Magnesium chelatase, subunit ChlI family protein n=1 Tax=Borrelia bissettiae (strain DSM 17990 / CIP 109136 / DN127) TaxID=521010 RepID=G0AKP8_BORBD|nr:YifB family Mg chelatase-like AAA ATPase [Borreliella bissettiae]AEL18274.1 magnesium chelatase, subunit ChlI family protein [Borreliella bissettiae DN127]WKC99534.1 YifB family Mg chelatase-like AAA ATPase [Borreliella bissettiae]